MFIIVMVSILANIVTRLVLMRINKSRSNATICAYYTYINSDQPDI